MPIDTRHGGSVPKPPMSPEQQAHFRVLKALEDRPDLRQRELAAAVGLSLGRTNFVLRGLMEKGMVKIGKFVRSDEKLVKTAYLLTPEGIRERTRLTRGYVERRQAEYEALKAELKRLRADLAAEPHMARQDEAR